MKNNNSIINNFLRFVKRIYRMLLPEYFRKKLRILLKNIQYFPISIPIFVSYLINNNNIFEDELSVVSIMKNEGPYLKEWIEYHKLVGVDRFYLYDNGSTDNTKEVIAPYINNRTVIYVEMSCVNSMGGGYLQMFAYNQTVKKYKNKTRWLAAIDLDEFIVPLYKNSIKDILYGNL